MRLLPFVPRRDGRKFDRRDRDVDTSESTDAGIFDPSSALTRRTTRDRLEVRQETIDRLLGFPSMGIYANPLLV